MAVPGGADRAGWRLPIWVLVAALTACGASSVGDPAEGDTDEDTTERDPLPTPEPFDSQADADTPIGDLSGEELEQVCDELDAYLEENLSEESLAEAGCDLAGAFAALTVAGLSSNDPDLTNLDAGELVDACEYAAEECLATELSEELQRIAGFSCARPGTDCEATVGQLETCVDDLIEVRNEIYSSVPTCPELATPGGVAALLRLGATEQPASCEELESCQ